jgi:hypothetical protein
MRYESPTMLSGERVLWSGEPGKGIYFRPMDIVLVPFSLIWCGIIFWMFSASAAARGAPQSFDLFGPIFVVFGLYFVFGRFLVDMWVRGGTHYSVTSRRILIDRGGPFPRQIAISLADLPPVELRARGSGAGTIRFGNNSNTWYGSRGFGAWSPSLDPTPQFIKIDNAKNVFDLINRARDDLLRTGQPGV